MERSKTEAQLKDKVGASECEINEFRNGNLFDLKLTGGTRGYEILEKFLRMPASECFA